MSMEWLANWYKSNCNGEWEHNEGITIVTLDNPGWHITISLNGTPLEKADFAEIEHEGDDENDWFTAKISNREETRELGGRCFIGAGGPDNFNDILAVFKALAEAQGDVNAVA